MSRLLPFLAAVGLKPLVCKGFSLGIVLLLFWLKGKKLEFNSKKWEDYFLQVPPQRIQRYAAAIYLTAAFLSSSVSFFILEAASCPYSLAMAVLLFAVGLTVTACRWQTKGKAYLLKRYQEIPNTILSQRNGEKIKHE